MPIIGKFAVRCESENPAGVCFPLRQDRDLLAFGRRLAVDDGLHGRILIAARDAHASLPSMFLFAAVLHPLPTLTKRPQLDIESPRAPRLMRDMPDLVRDGRGLDKEVVGPLRPALSRFTLVSSRQRGARMWTSRYSLNRTGGANHCDRAACSTLRRSASDQANLNNHCLYRKLKLWRVVMKSTQDGRCAVPSERPAHPC